MARGKSAASSGNGVGEIAVIGDIGTTGGAGDIGNSLTDAGFIVVDPAAIGDSGGSDNGDAGNSSGEPRKRRGRKPGTGAARSGKAPPLDINGVQALLFSAHNILAAITKTPEFSLSETESEELAKGIANVSRHYDVAASAKTVDIMNLAMVAGMIYGSRIMAMRNRKSAEKKAKKDAENTAAAFRAPYAVP
jgi:hypothetical protein